MWVQLNEKEMRTVLAALRVTNNAELAKSIEKSVEDPENAQLYRSAIDDKLGRDGEIEFDDDAVVSKGDDAGAYVQGWLWISDEDAGIEEGKEEDEDE